MTLIACAPPANMRAPTVTVPPIQGKAARERNAGQIIESFSSAWRGREEFTLARPITLGIWVDGEGYTVNLDEEGGSFVAEAPSRFDWGFETDLKTLQRIDSGSLNALTAMGRARASDPVPLDVRIPDDFSEGEHVRSFYIPLTRHFWDRQWPETIPFGDGTTRKVHGANTTVLIYDTGLRTAWYQLKPGMHVNSDPADQINEFHTAIVVTRGQFRGKIDGEERLFVEGEAVIVPSGTSHEFYTDQGEYGEFVILMWGDAA